MNNKWKAIGLHDDAIAEVGQTIRVKAVDENGAPTAWEVDNFTETDPTVPAWAKAESKPTYTYDEVGAAAEGLVKISSTEPTDEVTEIWINTAEEWNDNIVDPTDEQVTTAVNAWLDEHPEATTTVEDGSVTAAKLADGAVVMDKIDGVHLIKEQIFDYAEHNANGKQNTYLNYNTGADVSGNDSYKCTYYIPASGGVLYTTNLAPIWARVCCYDVDKTFIGTVDMTDTQFTTLDGTKFIRLSLWSGTHTAEQKKMICRGDALYDEYFIGKHITIDNIVGDGFIDNGISGTKLIDNTVSGKKLIDESVTRNKIGIIDPDSIEGVDFVNLFSADEFLNDINLGTDTDKVARGWLQASGTIVSTSTQYVTLFIPCKPNTEYSLYYWKDGVATVWAFSNRIGFRNANKEIFGVNVIDSVTFTTPNDAYEIVCTCPGVGGELELVPKLMLVYGSETPEYKPHKTMPNWLITNKQLDGMSMVCYGDSLTQNKYPSKVADMLGIAVTDAGVGGDTCNSITARIGNYGTDFDVVTLMVGTNDNGGQTSCPLGTADDDAATDDNATATDTTYAARLKRLLNKLKTTHRGATFVIMPPFEHAWSGLEPVAELMQEIAKQYKMPFLDIYHLCGWDGRDEEDAAIFMEDQTHENDVGAQRIAELLAGFIKQLKGA